MFDAAKFILYKGEGRVAELARKLAILEPDKEMTLSHVRSLALER